MIINFCKLTIFSCHRIKDLVFHNSTVKSEFTTSAEESFINSTLSVRHSFYKHISVCFQMHGASNRTIGAGGICNVCIQRNRFFQGKIFLKSTCRADTYTLTTGNTSCLCQRLFQSRHNNCIKSSFYKTKCANTHNFIAGTNTKSTEDTLVRISQDKRMLVVEFHLVDISCKTIWLNAVHIGICDQFTFKVIFTSTFQTSMSLFYSLLFVISEYYFCEVVFSFFSVELFHSRTTHSLTIFECSCCYILLGYIVIRLIFDFFATKISIYDQIALLCISDCFYSDRDLVITAVTTGKYARKCCHICIFVIYKAALAGKFCSFDTFSIDSLSNSKDNSIYINRFCFSFYRDRSATSGSIRLTKFHNLKYHLTTMSVLIGNDLQRIGQVQEDYAFFFCFFNLKHIGRHFVLGSSVDIVNLVSAKANCCTAGIHGCITTTNDGNVLTKVNCFVADNFTKEINTSDNALCVLAFAAYTCRYPCTDTYTDSVIISADHVKGNILADLCVCNHGYAHFFENCDFFIQCFLRKTIFRNTIAEHTTKFWHCFIDGNIMSQLTKEICHGDTVRSTTDHCYVLSCIRLTVRNKRIFTKLISICSKAFQIGDCNRFINQSTTACSLTWMRTYTSDGTRKRDVVSDQFDCFFKLSIGDQTYITLTVCSCRTCLHTWRTTVTFVVGKKKFQVCFSGFKYTFGIGMDDHIRCNLCCTGFPELRIAFHFYHTQTTCTIDFGSFIVTKSRNKNIVLFADFKNGLSRKSVDFFSIDI